MAMNPMSPRPSLPSAAAFRLLSELNNFFKQVPKKERESLLANYTNAAGQHQAAVDQIRQDLEASKADRDAAAEIKRQGAASERVNVVKAEAKATQIVDTATEQAESVNKTARENVAAAGLTVTAAEARAGVLTAGLAEAKEAVNAREIAVEAREAMAEERITEAEASKTEYETLIDEITAVQRRARK